MKVVIADDEGISRLKLETMLRRWGHQVIAVGDGEEAWQVLQTNDPPRLAILDWRMPKRDGVEICRLARQEASLKGIYLIMVTSMGGKQHAIAALRAGANDYITKPFDPEELEARVMVGVRVLQLQDELSQRVHELEAALTQVKRLQGLLPICCYCKKVRDDKAYWHQVESYVTQHSEAQFSHSVCPGCRESEIKPQLEQAGIPTTNDYPG